MENSDKIQNNSLQPENIHVLYQHIIGSLAPW